MIEIFLFVNIKNTISYNIYTLCTRLYRYYYYIGSKYIARYYHNILYGFARVIVCRNARTGNPQDCAGFVGPGIN